MKQFFNTWRVKQSDGSALGHVLDKGAKVDIVCLVCDCLCLLMYHWHRDYKRHHAVENFDFFWWAFWGDSKLN